MAIETIAERNMTAGLQVAFVYINDITYGLFIRLLLFMVWISVLLGIYLNQKRAIGYGDFPASFAVAGFATLIIAVLMRLVTGLLDGFSFAVVIIASIIGVIWLLFSRGKPY